MRARLGRLKHVPESIIVAATNPDSPAHSAYDYFNIGQNGIDNRHVFKSVTSDNPFLPKSYVADLLKVYTKQEAQRMIYGEWIEISRDVIYYEYCDNANVISSYRPVKSEPIMICYDFNIADGKPMSVVFGQRRAEKFIFFDEIIIYGARTLDTVEEAIARNLINAEFEYVIHGDATGRKRSTNYNKSDYDVIEKALANYHDHRGRPIRFSIDVPKANPNVRERHVIVNGQLCNAQDQRNILITKKCAMLRKGLRLTALKKGSQYQEDDDNEWQHVTTAMGYGVCRQLKQHLRGKRFIQTKL